MIFFNANIELEENEKEGRFYVSSESGLKIGSLLIKEEPFAFCLNEENRTLLCNYCFASKKLKRCKQCKYSHYCSVECYKLDKHDIECKALSKYSKFVTNSIRLATRCALECEKSIDCKKEFMNLIGHNLEKDNVKNTDLNLIQLSALTKQYIDETGFIKDVDISYCYSIISRLQRNTFTICNEEMNNIGSGIYLKSSLFNHSCTPNCTVTFDKDKHIYIRVIEENINIGDPLTINYVDLLDVTPNRKEKLLKQYHFECNCTRCNNSKEERNENLEQMLKVINDYKQKQEFDKAVNCLKRIIAKGSTNAFHEIYLGIAYNELAHININLSNFHEALEYTKQSLVYFEKYYPKNYPLLGLQYLMYNKLMDYCNDQSFNLPPLRN
ncbi:hypothetical protein ABK040_009839 [Willaertia magna]